MENREKTLGLVVQRERLRDRLNLAKTAAASPTAPAAPTAPATPTGPGTPASPLASPASAHPLTAHITVNWLKYNVLVSIYHNWLRLEPFIRYWLSRTYPSEEREGSRLWPFLRRIRQQEKPCGEGRKEGGLDLLEEMRARRQQLLSGLPPCQADTAQLCFARQLARQLLSTLPLQNNKWSKLRIQKQNRLLDEMIHNFDEGQFQMNSDAIMHSLKERIYFIDEMQKKFIDLSNQQKHTLEEKLQLLKLPFQRAFTKNKAARVDPQALFESLWQEIESERTKLLTKKPELRHAHRRARPKQRYAILEKSESDLVVKYQLRHGDYFNDAYVRNKLSRNRTKKLRKPRDSSNSLDETLEGKAAELTKDSAAEAPAESSQSGASSGEQRSRELEQEELNAQFVEDFMRRQRLKPTYRDQNPLFAKKVGPKLEGHSLYRPSISYIDGRSNRDTDNARSGQSMPRERTSLFFRRESRQRPSAEQAEREDHLSRFRSHKKLITLKSIGGVSRHTKLREQGKKDSQLGTLSRISERQGRLQRREFRREPVDYRRGVLHKKAAHRREVVLDDDALPDASLALNRQEFLSYFNKILAAGHLDHSHYEDLRDQVQNLVRKNEAPALQETHAYVEKLVEKSAEEQLGWACGEGREALLMELGAVVGRDERIRARIREEMKIYFSEQVEQCCSEDSICNEQLLYNTTELRKVTHQLRRILAFRREGQALDFAQRLTRENDSLLQRTL